MPIAHLSRSDCTVQHCTVYHCTHYLRDSTTLLDTELETCHVAVKKKALIHLSQKLLLRLSSGRRKFAFAAAKRLFFQESKEEDFQVVLLSAKRKAVVEKK